MSRPEAHFGGLHENQSRQMSVREVSEQAGDPHCGGRLGGRGRTAKGLEDANEFIQVRDSEGSMTNLEQKGREDELSSCLGHVEVGGWRLGEKRSSDKLRNRAQVLGSSVLSSSPSIPSCFTLKPCFLLLYVVLKPKTKIKTKIWGFFQMLCWPAWPACSAAARPATGGGELRGCNDKHVLQH